MDIAITALYSLACMTPYQKLARDILKHYENHKQFETACRALKISSEQYQLWSSGQVDIRLSTFFLLIQKMQISVLNLMAVVVAPFPLKSSQNIKTKVQMESHLIVPVIKRIRKDYTLKEIKKILDTKSTASYNHWENGRRSVSLSVFLKMVDLLVKRLPDFCEALKFERDLNSYQLSTALRPTDFSFMFFGLPWTPTVYLAAVTGQIQPDQKITEKFAAQFGLTSEQIQQSLKILFDLRLLSIENKKYQTRKQYFLAPPTLDKQLVTGLSDYWFSKSQSLQQLPGYHKIDQLTFSKESQAKITTWVAELRERIQKESKNGPPETILHFHWQIANLG